MFVCVVLYLVILYCMILFRSVVLYWIELCCMAQEFIAWHKNSLHGTGIHCMAQEFIAWHKNSLHGTGIHCLEGHGGTRVCGHLVGDEDADVVLF